MTEPLAERSQVTSRALRWSIFIATTLASVKFIVAMLTHSMAMMASALDSLLDLASSSVNLFASIKAVKPPDDNHDYGHEKIESLASLIQSLLILISGIFIVLESAKRFFYGSDLHNLGVGIAVMLFSMALTLFLSLKLHKAAHESKSLILKTENLHYSMDLLTNGGTLAALFLVRLTGKVQWDLFFSLVIAAYILKTSLGIFWHAVNELLDHSLPNLSKEEIARIILDYNPKIINLHNFRSRKVGHKIFLDFHIEIRDENDFRKAHDLTEGLIEKIQSRYPEADITVHYDPEGAK